MQTVAPGGGEEGVRLVGLDFGTTTSSAVIASARLEHNAVTGRRQFSDVHEIYRSEMVFTPYTESGLDELRLQEYLDEWLTAARVRPDEIFGGGALLTGLAAEQSNASALTRLIRSRLGNTLIATAGDPCLESWLAFQASTAALSKSRPERWFVNLDIGGGTTNIAIGKNGDVLRTGCLFVGARHVQLVPGSYRIAKLSTYGRSLLEHLQIATDVGTILDEKQIKAIVDFYLRLIENAIAGRVEEYQAPIVRLHQQVSLNPPREMHAPIVTVSGGVGELVYASLLGKPLPSTTFFGDLGIDLAERLVASPDWTADFKTHIPAHTGRATVYGLLQHTTQISGATIFLADDAILPLRDLPVLGRLTPNSTDDQIRDILELVRRSPVGGCVQVLQPGAGASAVAELGTRFSEALNAIGFSRTHPLVLLVGENVGKALGHYITRWDVNPFKLIVLDEIEVRDARFIQIGRMQNHVVPVSFYGMN